MNSTTTLLALVLVTQAVAAREYHVAVTGNDRADGSPSAPLRTLAAAARAAQPGDGITVHAGTYRERVTPPRGGESDTKRITYQAAPGETVVLKGSEVARGWEPFLPGIWKLTLPNAYFGRYNPYQDRITGDWFKDNGRPHHTGEVYLNGKSLWETHLLERVLQPAPVDGSEDREGSTWTWFCEVDAHFTHIYANFHDRNPNRELVEINVRDSCFYPDQPGRDYLTVRGFRMGHAATQWAAPTAEQIGLIGTHWSKGWIIEDNVISDSKCSGITLGKDRKSGHNVWTNDPRKDGATHYNEVVDRALAAGWSRATIGSHVVRRNTIFNCEQTGICGSLGAVFSRITDNHIHHIWTKRQFAGAEIAGIKLHAAIDVVIQHNRIHHAGRGLWMDWMAQGTRLSGNLCYANTTDDLFVEVNHGPFLVDNNLFLSDVSLRDVSEGGAYAHNLMAGRIVSQPELKRSTPFHLAHATALAGRSNIPGGDNRFYNNLLVSGPGGDGAPVPPAKAVSGPARVSGYGLWVYDAREAPLATGGNVHANGARPYGRETEGAVAVAWNPSLALEESDGGGYLSLYLVPALTQVATTGVTTARLGRTRLSNLGYENADGSALRIDTDYLGRPRDPARPTAGPFEQPGTGPQRIKIW